MRNLYNPSTINAFRPSGNLCIPAFPEAQPLTQISAGCSEPFGQNAKRVSLSQDARKWMLAYLTIAKSQNRQLGRSRNGVCNTSTRPKMTDKTAHSGNYSRNGAETRQAAPVDSATEPDTVMKEGTTVNQIALSFSPMPGLSALPMSESRSRALQELVRKRVTPVFHGIKDVMQGQAQFG